MSGLPRSATQPLRRTARLQDRIVVFFIALLALAQFASFTAIHYAITSTSESTMRDELGVGSRVFRRVLDQAGELRVEEARALTYDGAFRAALAAGDRPALVAALREHTARSEAAGMTAFGLDGKIVASTRPEALPGTPFAFPELAARAATAGRAWGIRVIDGRPCQVAVVPVLAPSRIGWVSMSGEIDERTLRELRELTSSDISFVQLAREGPRQLTSTLPTSVRARFLEMLPETVRHARGETFPMRLNDMDFEALVQRLEDGEESVYVVLQRSTADGLRAYLLIEAIMPIIAALSLAITLAGAIRIARRITRPVTRLAEAAREIGRGNYAVRVGGTGDDEIAELGRSFDNMAQGLAERNTMRDVLGKVASSEVVLQLMEGKIELGGEERDTTVMFTDIRNFTAIAESLTPDQSLQMLNQFLTAITEVIEAHGGVVDKFLGDGAMAIFGAPVPRDDHPLRAVSCAVDIRHSIAALGPWLARRGLPHPQVGVGVNTSVVIVGNIGSTTRLNYTALGDGVNLASRLEGLTKRYHVPIVVGESTHMRAPGFVWRELDIVRVRGRKRPERIFEPLGREGTIGEADLGTLGIWHAALEDYRGRRWAEAARGLDALAALPDYQRLVTIYRGYLAEVEASPPPADWQPAFTLYEK